MFNIKLGKVHHIPPQTEEILIKESTHPNFKYQTKDSQICFEGHNNEDFIHYIPDGGTVTVFHSKENKSSAIVDNIINYENEDYKKIEHKRIRSFKVIDPQTDDNKFENRIALTGCLRLCSQKDGIGVLPKKQWGIRYGRFTKPYAINELGEEVAVKRFIRVVGNVQYLVTEIDPVDFVRCMTAGLKIWIDPDYDFNTTADFDAGTKSTPVVPDGYTQIQTETDNPSIPAGEMQLANPMGDGFATIWDYIADGASRYWDAIVSRFAAGNTNVENWNANDDTANKLFTRIEATPAGIQYLHSNSIFQLNKNYDFSVQILLDRLTTGNVNVWQFGVFDRPDWWNDADCNGCLFYHAFDGAHEWETWKYTNSAGTQQGTSTVDNTNPAYMRISYVAATGTWSTAFSADGAAWTPDETFVQALARDAYVMIRVGTSASVNCEADWDNFQITAGTLVGNEYETAADWESDNIDTGVLCFEDCTIDHSDLDGANYIGYVNFYVGGVLKAAYTTNITAGASTLIEEGDLTFGTFVHVKGPDVTVKIGVVGDGTTTPIIERIYGDFIVCVAPPIVFDSETILAARKKISDSEYWNSCVVHGARINNEQIIGMWPNVEAGQESGSGAVGPEWPTEPKTAFISDTDIKSVGDAKSVAYQKVMQSRRVREYIEANLILTDRHHQLVIGNSYKLREDRRGIYGTYRLVSVSAPRDKTTLAVSARFEEILPGDNPTLCEDYIEIAIDETGKAYVGNKAGTEYWQGQTFTPIIDMTLCVIWVWIDTMYSSYSTPPTLICRLYETLAGAPTGAAIDSTQSLTPGQIVPGAWNAFPFPRPREDVESNTVYFVSIEALAASGADDYYDLITDSANPYSGGQRFEADGGWADPPGGAWTAVAGHDLKIRIGYET